MAAFVATVYMASQGGCTANLDRLHNPPLIRANRILFPIRLTVDAEDVGYLPRRLSHVFLPDARVG
jgi:hypothetical protein